MAGAPLPGTPDECLSDLDGRAPTVGHPDGRPGVAPPRYRGRADGCHRSASPLADPDSLDSTLCRQKRAPVSPLLGKLGYFAFSRRLRRYATPAGPAYSLQYVVDRTRKGADQRTLVVDRRRHRF